MILKLPYNLIKDLAIFTLSSASRVATYPSIIQQASYNTKLDQKGAIKLTKNLLISYLVGFFALSSVAGLFLFNPFGAKEADAAWFNDSWAYRKALTVTVTSTATDRTNVYSLLTIDTNLTSTKLQGSCQDLRFTDSTGIVIPYYIVSTASCNTNSSNKIWVLMPTVYANTTSYVIYMYYGNPTATAGSNAQQLPLIDGLQGYWKLNESSGNANDSSANTNTLTNNNTATYVAGQFANAGNYVSASSQYMNITDGSQTGMEGMTATTYAFWVNPTTAVFGPLLQKDASNGQCSYNISTLGSGEVKISTCPSGFYNGAADFTSATGLLPTTTWTHVVITNAGGIVKLYINGVPVTSGSFPATIDTSTVADTTSDFSIAGGASNGSGISYFNGKMDDVRVYNRELSPADISTLYTGTGDAYLNSASTKTTASAGSEVAGPAPGLYWKFNEGQGTTANNSVTAQQDTPAFVQSKSTQGATANGVAQTAAFTSTTTPGNLLIVQCTEASTSTNFTLTNTASLTFNTSTTTLKQAFTGTTIQIFYAYNIPAISSFQATCTGSDSSNLATATALEYSGVLQTDDPLDQTSGSTGTGGTNITSGTITTTIGNELHFTGVAADTTAGGTLSWTAAANWTKRENGTNNSTREGFATGDNVTIGTGSFQQTWSSWAGTGRWSTLIVSFKPKPLTGTLGGTTVPTWQTENQCISGKCLYFDGTTSKVTGSQAVLGVKSVGFWVRPNTIATQGLLTLNESSSTRALTTDGSGVISATNFTSPTYYINGIATTTPTLVINQWNYVVVTTATGVDSGTAIKLGTDGTNFTKGFFDEFKLYNSQLTAAQVAVNYNARSNIEGVSQQQGNNTQNMPAALSNGLVGYWKMDETAWTNNCSTTTVTDSSGNANNGISCPNTTGPTGAGAGKFSFAGSFDGSNDYLSVANSTSLNPTGSWTVSTWFTNADSSIGASEMYLLSKGNWNSDADSPFRLSSNFGTLTLEYRASFTSYSVTYDLSGAGFTTNQWIHATGTYDAPTRNLSLYVNGKLVASSIKAATYANNTSVLYIGAHSSGQNFWKGKIDDTRIYNRALSATDVAQLANWAPTPLLYYSFDDNTGSTVSDTSGNSNNGTWSGTANYWVPGKYGGSGNFGGTTGNNSVGGGSATSIDNILNTGGMTVGFWFNEKADAGQTTHNVINKDNNGVNGWAILLNEDNLQLSCRIDFSVTDISGSTSAGTYSRNVWNYASYVIDTSTSTPTCKIYLNGVLQSTFSGSGTPVTDAARNLEIGRQNGSNANLMNGMIDDVRIYNYTRSVGQITEDMNAGHPAPGSPVGSPYGYWKFDEGVANTCSGGTNDVCNSGNGGTTLDGQFTGTPTYTNNGKFGKAISFNGSSNNADMSAMEGTESAANITWSLWVNPTSLSTDDCLFCKIQTPTGTPAGSIWGIITDSSDSSRVKVIIPTATNSVATYGLTPSGTLSNGTWTHLVVVYDGTQTGNSDRLKVYVNGKPQTISFTGTIPATTTTSTTNGRIASDSQGTANFFNGVFDEVKVYLSSLTPQQVLLDMNRGQAQVLGALSNSSTAGNDNSSTRTAQSGASEYCIPGDSSTCTGPVGRWDFEEGTGTTAYDTSGTGNNGTINSSLTFTNGKIGKGINFIGTDGDCVVIPNTTVSSLTYEMWYKSPTTSGSRELLGNMNTLFRLNSTDLTWFPDTTKAAVSTTISINADTWYHLAVTQTGTTYTMYVNGSQVVTGTTFALNTGSTTSGIGCLLNHPGTGIAKQIDQVRIFNYARTATQVAYDYNRGAPIAQWKMDECQGVTINDSSGNSYTGTLTVGGTVGTCQTSSTSWGNGVTGKRNYSIDLNGSSDYIQVTDTSALRFDAATADFSLFAWVKRDTNGEMNIISKEDADNDGYRLEFTSGNAVRCSVNSIDIDSTRTITDTNWHLVGCTISRAGNGQVYIDGQANGTATAISSTVMATTSNIRLGTRSYTSTNYLDGLLDDTRIYNYALTASQVKTLYNQGAANYGPVTGAP